MLRVIQMKISFSTRRTSCYIDLGRKIGGLSGWQETHARNTHIHTHIHMHQRLVLLGKMKLFGLGQESDCVIVSVRLKTSAR